MAEELKDNTFVTRSIGRLDSDVTKKSAAGRKKKYTPTKMRNAINKYFESCELTDEVPSIKGLMIHLKMYKDVFYKYMEYPEFSNMMEHTRLIIGNWIESDIYRTKGLAAGKIAYAKNLHGWSDRIESTSTITQTTISIDQAKAKIEMLAPKLLELLKNTSLVNQIATDKVIDAEVESVRRV